MLAPTRCYDTSLTVGLVITGVGFRMALAPALTPLERMRQQLASRSLAGLGIEDASELIASCQDAKLGLRATPGSAAARQPSLPQPPLVPRRVSLTVIHPPQARSTHLAFAMFECNSQQCVLSQHCFDEMEMQPALAEAGKLTNRLC